MMPSSSQDANPPLKASDPRLLMGSKDKNVLWSHPRFPDLDRDQKDFLENYSQLKHEVITPHILAIVSSQRSSHNHS